MMNSKWFLVLVAVIFVSVFSLGKINVVSLVGADNTSSASLVVAGLIDTTINCSVLSLGTGWVAGGTANSTRPDTQQCLMTINSNTNTVTTISVNASDNFTKASTYFGSQNITYTNNSGTQGSCLTSFGAVSGSYMSGNCPGIPHNYTDWVTIAAPNGSNILRNMYFNVTVPVGLPKGTYVGSIFIKFIDG